MADEILLLVDGAVENRLELRYADLAALPVSQQVPDVSRFHPKRQGDGVVLEAILERARPRAEANYLTLHADRDDFHDLRPVAKPRLARRAFDSDHLDNVGRILILARGESKNCVVSLSGFLFRPDPARSRRHRSKQ